ncbi:hypothetical protein RB195_014933 [Necator americanus]|uniref:Uncharacterized protein n=1 Tax=Necator americanus TaxID=51031 RepID=A0ABR1E4X3_NECAM
MKSISFVSQLVLVFGAFIDLNEDLKEDSGSTVPQLEWCDLYSPIDTPQNPTIVIFHRMRTHYEKKLFDDIFCLLKSTRILLLEMNTTHTGNQGLPLPRGEACAEVVNMVSRKNYTQTRTAIVMLGAPTCDIDKTSTLLARVKNHKRISFWKLVPCFNCSLVVTEYETNENILVHLAAVPFITGTHLFPDMNAVHALATHIAGVPVALDLKNLYAQIAKEGQDEKFRLTSNWEKGGNIAALVTLIFMFFLMSLFVCCCAFTQSAFIIEDFNYRDELHLNWRGFANEQVNGPNQQAEANDISMHSEATQVSVAESLHRTSGTIKTLEGETLSLL